MREEAWSMPRLGRIFHHERGKSDPVEQWKLDLYRQSFSHEMNTMHKDLATRTQSSTACAKSMSRRGALRKWPRNSRAGVLAVAVSDRNGAVDLWNSFVEWAASEAFHAPGLFSGSAIRSAQQAQALTRGRLRQSDQVNPLPAVDDLPGSAVDAQMLALYVWLAAYRYQEYQSSTVCVCLAESLSQAYVVAPREFTLCRKRNRSLSTGSTTHCAPGLHSGCAD